MRNGSRIMTIWKHLATTVVALLTLTFSLGAAADWQAEEGDRLQQRAQEAISKVREKVERSHPYFEDAYAMAVWPGITRVARCLRQRRRNRTG
jgi:hypothetical protein